MITLSGRFFTKEYGNMNFQDGDDTDMTSRREESITAILLGGRGCELTDELGNIYGLSLESSGSDEGSMTCKPGGTFIGPTNATVFISGTASSAIPVSSFGPSPRAPHTTKAWQSFAGSCLGGTAGAHMG